MVDLLAYWHRRLLPLRRSSYRVKDPLLANRIPPAARCVSVSVYRGMSRITIQSIGQARGE